jgi:hypothetical protein
MHVGRVHPIVSNLAQGLTEAALDPHSSIFGGKLGRAGIWRSADIQAMTTILLLRLRFKLTSSGKRNRLLLAEEATGIVFNGKDHTAHITGPEALALLEGEASGDVASTAKNRQLEDALTRLPSYESAIRKHAVERAKKLEEDHLRLTEASRGGARIEVIPSLPADIIGLYVLLPEML